jgi:hypothetical protein
METYRLSDLVLSVKPDLYHLLTPKELELPIVLQYGLKSVKTEDLIEIIEASIIHTHQEGTFH